MTKHTKPGPTGDFPRGKFNAHDSGGLAIAIGVKDKTVVLDFGTSVKWIGLSKEEAILFGEAIVAKAKML